MRTVTLIPGDGIGPDVTNAAVRVVEAAGIRIKWEIAQAGMTATLIKSGDPLPRTTIESIKRNKVALKGPLGTPIGEGFQSVNVQLRKMFDLHLNLRPIRSFKGIKGLHDAVDLVVCRENTEELYIGEEEYLWNPVTRELVGAKMVGRITYAGSRRFFRSVFDYAKNQKRKKVTVLHKANILKLTNGIFIEVAEEIARDYPDIVFEKRIVDAGSMQVVMDPHNFDVIATTNLFGDIISDIFAGLVGGLGTIAGANIGEEYAIFEAVHGTAPDISGQNKANPTALILSAALMLRHIGENKAARRIEMVVESIIAEGKSVTRDLNPGSGVGTKEMTDAIIGRVNDYFDLEAENCA